MRTARWPFSSWAMYRGASTARERATLLELATFLRDNDWDSRIVVLEGDGAAEMIRRAAEHGIACEAYVPTVVNNNRLGFFPMLRKTGERRSRGNRAPSFIRMATSRTY